MTRTISLSLSLPAKYVEGLMGGYYFGDRIIACKVNLETNHLVITTTLPG